MDSNLTNHANATAKPAEIVRLESILWYFQVVFLSFTIFAALVGNLLVLGATYLDRRLHNANKYFVASLAVSDLLVALFSVTLRLHQYLNHTTPLNIALCRFYIWVDIFTEAASITTLTTISIDRYYKVSRPFEYRANMTTHRASYIIAFIWIYSAILGALGLIPYPGNKAVHIAEKKCLNENKTFYTLAALLCFFIPVAILIILCALIFRIVQVHGRKRLPSQDGNDHDCARIHQKGQTHSNRRSLLTLALIVLTFIVCWGPFFVLFVIFQYTPQLLSAMGLYGFKIMSCVCFGVLPYANSFLNPIIYAFFDKTFNVAIKDMLLRLCKGSKYYSMYHSSTVRMSRASRHCSKAPASPV